MTNIKTMFNDRMSSSQLLAEYYEDLPGIQEQTICFAQSDYVSKHLKRHRMQEQVLITRFFTSLHGNGYLGILVYTKSEEVFQKEWSLSAFHIGLMNTSKGICAIAFYTQSKHAIKFTTHFFHRYKERFKQICDLETHSQLELAKSVVDIMTVYMKRNLTMTWIETRSVFRNKVHIFAPINDGVALLQWDKHKHLLQANTFVSMDMLDDKQIEMVKYARIYSSLSNEERAKLKHPDFISKDESIIN